MCHLSTRQCTNVYIHPVAFSSSTLRLQLWKMHQSQRARAEGRGCMSAPAFGRFNFFLLAHSNTSSGASQGQAGTGRHITPSLITGAGVMPWEKINLYHFIVAVFLQASMCTNQSFHFLVKGISSALLRPAPPAPRSAVLRSAAACASCTEERSPPLCCGLRLLHRGAQSSALLRPAPPAPRSAVLRSAAACASCTEERSSPLCCGLRLLHRGAQFSALLRPCASCTEERSPPLCCGLRLLHRGAQSSALLRPAPPAPRSTVLRSAAPPAPPAPRSAVLRSATACTSCTEEHSPPLCCTSCTSCTRGAQSSSLLRPAPPAPRSSVLRSAAACASCTEEHSPPLCCGLRLLHRGAQFSALPRPAPPAPRSTVRSSSTEHNEWDHTDFHTFSAKFSSRFEK